MGQLLPPERLERLNFSDEYLEDALTSLLYMYVQRAKNENCEGCEKSWSSQRDHSCLMHTTDELCERYFDAAYTRLNEKLVGAVYGFDGKNPGMMLDNFQDYKKEKSDMFRKKNWNSITITINEPSGLLSNN